MKILIGFILFFTVSTSVMAQAPAGQNQIPPATKQKLEAIWAGYEKIYNLGEFSVRGYISKTPEDPNVSRLLQTAVFNKAISEIGNLFQQRLYETFSEKELDYLIQLYSSPVAKKLSVLEKNFWNNKTANAVIKSVIAAPVPAPAVQPKPGAVAPKAAPAPQPKK